MSDEPEQRRPARRRRFQPHDEYGGCAGADGGRAIVMISSYRLGAGWAKDVGPGFGLFPVLRLADHVRRQRRHPAAALCRARRDGEGSFIAPRRADDGAAGPDPDDHLRHAVDLHRNLHLDVPVHRLLHDLARPLSALQDDPGGASPCRSCCSSCSKSGFWCRCRRGRSRPGSATEAGAAGRKQSDECNATKQKQLCCAHCAG